MIIVLINWRILRGSEDKFLHDWQTKFKVNQKPGLIGEFLSEVKDASFYEKITWEIGPGEDENKKNWRTSSFSSYVNVGFWMDKKLFDNAVGHNMPIDPSDPDQWQDYAAAPRRRAVLKPAAWRIGPLARFPLQSSNGVIL